MNNNSKTREFVLSKGIPLMSSVNSSFPWSNSFLESADMQIDTCTTLQYKTKQWILSILDVLNTSLTADEYLWIKNEVAEWDDSQWERVVHSLFTSLRTGRDFCHAKTELLATNERNKPLDYLIICPTSNVSSYARNIERMLEIMYRSKKGGLLAIVLDSAIDPEWISLLKRKLDASNIPYYLFQNYTNLGYLQSIKVAVNEIMNLDFSYVGFVDDDAYVNRMDHYDLLISLLEKCEKLYSVSGLSCDENSNSLIHNFLNTTNNYSFFQEAYEQGHMLSKPHIHGGGGACLLRKKDFLTSLDVSLSNNTLLGPTISVLGRSEWYECRAINSSLVLHPTKTTFFEWFCMIRKYGKTWKHLKSLIGLPDNFTEEYFLKERAVFESMRWGKEFEKYKLLKTMRSKISLRTP